MAWEDLTEEQRFTQLVGWLELNEVGLADRVLAHRYIQRKHDALDAADVMQLDLEWWDAVRALRDLGRISTTEYLETQAKTMVNYNPDEMRRELHRQADLYRARAVRVVSAYTPDGTHHLGVALQRADHGYAASDGTWFYQDGKHHIPCWLTEEDARKFADGAGLLVQN